MDNYSFFITDDNTTGIYSNLVNDIFHSKTGALKEAIEKFLLPSKYCEYYKNFDEIKILDICYGIGYNTKALLLNSENKKVKIDSIEINNEFPILSPFIKDGVNDTELSFFIIKSLINSGISIDEINQKINIITGENYKFFNPNHIALFKSFYNNVYKTSSTAYKDAFLHNIYYSYISNNNNSSLKTNKYEGCTLEFKMGDARKIIPTLNTSYDIIFLDAFSPQKDPTLWTADFLSQIEKHMKQNSILVSYSKSTPFRSTLLNLGFYISKTFIKNIDSGTVASKNNDLILTNLNDFDYGLYNTTAGIPYRDENLNLSANDILLNRNIEMKKSTLLSHTQFLKLNSK
ncbi:MAG: hypothetical protein LUG16_04245 [Candidatus Gastranaerophilales bacterium]|nr:hypothetical protein [Candidatus Gastranaerophilales bacterium]